MTRPSFSWLGRAGFVVAVVGSGMSVRAYSDAQDRAHRLQVRYDNLAASDAVKLAQIYGVASQLHDQLVTIGVRPAVQIPAAQIVLEPSPPGPTVVVTTPSTRPTTTTTAVPPAPRPTTPTTVCVIDHLGCHG